MLAFPTPQDEDDELLSVGQITGIAIGVSVGTLLLVIISVLVGYCLWCVGVCMCVCVCLIINLLHINYIYIGCITWMDDSHLLRKVLRKHLISV